MGQDQVSGGVSVLCWLATPVFDVIKFKQLLIFCSYYWHLISWMNQLANQPLAIYCFLMFGD